MTVLDTNARAICDVDGDLAGYVWPEGEPTVTHMFVCKPGPRGRLDTVDELVYRLTWPDGTWAEMATPPRSFAKTGEQPL